MRVATEELQEEIPIPLEVIEAFSLSSQEKEALSLQRQRIQAVIAGVDRRKLLIVGPCSLHDERSAYEYGEKLLRLEERLEQRFILIMRAYMEKPRTRKGWKGLIYDPDLDGSHNIRKGLFISRKILYTLAKMGLALGSELLELTTAPYFTDLLSWGCIGARTSMSQPHRQLASQMPFPVGFKNSTDGNIHNAIHGISSAASPHSYLGVNEEGRVCEMVTEGNRFAHLVLRGGEGGPNYDKASILEAQKRCLAAQIPPRMIIDCSHDNSLKREENQKKVFKEVMGYEERAIIGLMLESHLYGGSQTLSSSLRYGISITDSCLSWEETQDLLLCASTLLP